MNTENLRKAATAAADRASYIRNLATSAPGLSAADEALIRAEAARAEAAADNARAAWRAAESAEISGDRLRRLRSEAPATARAILGGDLELRALFSGELADPESSISLSLDDEAARVLQAAYVAGRSEIMACTSERLLPRWSNDLSVAGLALGSVPVVTEGTAAAVAAVIDGTANSGSTWPIRSAVIEMSRHRIYGENSSPAERFRLLGRAHARTEARAVVTALASADWSNATTIGTPWGLNLENAVRAREAVTIGGERPPRPKFLIVGDADAVTMEPAGFNALSGLTLISIDGLADGVGYLIADPEDLRAIEIRRPAFDPKPTLERRSSGLVASCKWLSTNSFSVSIATNGTGKPLGMHRISPV
jgi:hypothetical protein